MPEQASSVAQQQELPEIQFRRFAYALLHTTQRISWLREHFREMFETLIQIRMMVYPIVMDDQQITERLVGESEAEIQRAAEWFRKLEAELQRLLLSAPKIKLGLFTACNVLYERQAWNQTPGIDPQVGNPHKLEALIESERQWFLSHGVPIDAEGKEVFHG